MIESHSSTEPEYRQIERLIGYRFDGEGSVWSCWKMGPKGGLSDKWRRMTLKPSNGYLKVNLKVNGGKQENFWVHRLILEAFVGPCPEGLECLHRDDNRSNNRIGNLRWGTHVENVADSKRNGTCQAGLIGSANRSAKVTEDDIPVIRQLSENGFSYPEIAARYGLTPENVHYIVKRKTWAHVA